MKPAIRVENLSKCYQLGSGPRVAYRTLRESVNQSVHAMWQRWCRGAASSPAGDTLWALRDVSVEIMPGEVVGIIGRNGAGKSTLLKVLSRITDPSAGRVEMRGRIGSLLEVGTGFHAELTGRENIYLNGAILGMRRQEIQRRFHEIVAFAEVERFLDTPVKRYSSGMYVRLAFAVAAHLEPEILLVDEVLAVGDATFQNRCLQKMGDFCDSGRTILFVSHNLSSIRTLCRQAIVMNSGRVVSRGPADAQVAAYLAAMSPGSGQNLDERTDREGNGDARLIELRLRDDHGHDVESILSGSELSVALRYRLREGADLDVAALSFWSVDGTKMFHVDNRQRGLRLRSYGSHGELVCRFPRVNLAPGIYRINALLAANGGVADHVFAAGTVTVLPGDFFGSGRLSTPEGGVIFMDHEWCQETESSIHMRGPISCGNAS
jgi:lipopolysaccharide transport system ATP-binding protein